MIPIKLSLRVLLILQTVSATNSQFETEILNFHNVARRRIGAADMRALTWNISLATSAASWASQCNGAQVDPSLAGAVGENMHVEPNAMPSAIVLANNSVMQWVSEGVSFNVTQETTLTKIAQVGRFTQLAWSNTTSLGCASAQCGTDTLVSCRYWPPGNTGMNTAAGWVLPANSAWLLGAPCSSCGSGTSCFESLCATADEAIQLGLSPGILRDPMSAVPPTSPCEAGKYPVSSNSMTTCTACDCATDVGAVDNNCLQSQLVVADPSNVNNTLTLGVGQCRCSDFTQFGGRRCAQMPCGMDSDCQPRGRCIDGHCTCLPNADELCKNCTNGFAFDATSRTCVSCGCNDAGTLRDSAGRLRCDQATQNCVCADRFSGQNCAIASCTSDADCGNNGRCDAAQGCVCNTGYAPPLCTTCEDGFILQPGINGSMVCEACNCSVATGGASTAQCDTEGFCTCATGAFGRKCDRQLECSVTVDASTAADPTTAACRSAVLSLDGSCVRGVCITARDRLISVLLRRDTTDLLTSSFVTSIEFRQQAAREFARVNTVNADHLWISAEVAEDGLSVGVLIAVRPLVDANVDDAVADMARDATFEAALAALTDAQSSLRLSGQIFRLTVKANEAARPSGGTPAPRTNDSNDTSVFTVVFVVVVVVLLVLALIVWKLTTRRRRRRSTDSEQTQETSNESRRSDRGGGFEPTENSRTKSDRILRLRQQHRYPNRHQSTSQEEISFDSLLDD